jgi:hypothetical protein
MPFVDLDNILFQKLESPVYYCFNVGKLCILFLRCKVGFLKEYFLHL